MKQAFSTKWKASIQPRKQRKYVANAPLHTQGTFLHVHLSKALRDKHKTRVLRVRKGDKVKVLRGGNRGAEQKVDRVDTKNGRVFLQKMERAKKEGGVIPIPFSPSNLMITELDTTDKRRLKKANKE
jgi:large subunit ribosomal protein L24